MSDENVEREKSWSEFVSNNGLTYAAEQQLRVAFIGGWVRGRASRPREAGKDPEDGENQRGEENGDRPPPGAPPRGPITSEEIKAHAKALNASASIDPYGGYGRAPTPHTPLAPEACPVAWQVVSTHDGYSWGVFDRSNGGEQKAAEFARRGPHRVVPLYATPASAAGREVAHGPGKCLSVDAIEFDRTVASREQDERERWIREDERAKCLHAAKHSPACKGCKRVMANAIRALLAAEAEGGWES